MATLRRTNRKMVPGTKPANSYVLPPEKLEQREQAFRIYRDMGRARSLALLAKELKQHYPEIAVSRITLEKWSHAHEWQDRVKAHDKAVGRCHPAEGDVA